MSGADIAAEVAAAIGEAGAETGNGSPLTGQIVRTIGADESTYPPTPGSATPYACTLLLSAYSVRERAMAHIGESDVKAMISPDVETDPRIGDDLTVGGKIYSIINVETVQPGGDVLLWKCQVRSGDT